MQTIGAVLDRNQGVGKGFDFLRIFLALSVLLTHSFLIAEGEHHQFSGQPFSFLHGSILPAFFALSGFLITGSAIRLKLSDFLLNRGMRIIPALAVDIFLSALILGPVFTVVSYSEYFSSYEFYAYFANLFGVIHYILPGVFEGNPFPATVNGSLWTIPFEIGCYALMSFCILSGILRYKWLCFFSAIILLEIVIYFYAFDVAPLKVLAETTGVAFLESERLGNFLAHFFSDRGNKLYIYFMLGSLFYLFRYSIPFHKGLLFASVVVCGIGAFMDLSHTPSGLRLIAFSPFLVYIIVAVGLVEIPRLPLYGRGDYSYGIYLYGFPLQQALVAIFPWMSSPLVHFLFSIIIVTCVAMMSWHYIEKPILNLRRKFSVSEREAGSADQREPFYQRVVNAIKSALVNTPGLKKATRGI